MNQVHFSHCKRKSFEPKVQNGLSVTPSLMEDMAKRGIPISAPNSIMEYDSTSVPNGDFSIPVDFQRGVDIADTWNAEKDSRSKMRYARKSGKVVEPKTD